MSQFSFQCPFCRERISTDTMWCGGFAPCRFCGNYLRIPQKKNYNHIVILGVGIFVIVFFFIPIVICTTVFLMTQEPESSYSVSSGDYSDSESDHIAEGKKILAGHYINNDLPAEQRNTLLYGTGGTTNDQANAMANLMKSGHLKGAASYLK